MNKLCRNREAFEPEEYKPCARCGELLEVGRKKQGIWHKDDLRELGVYHRKCLEEIVDLKGK